MNAVGPSVAIRRQRVAFYFALANFLALVAWNGVRIYLEHRGDSDEARGFGLHPNVVLMLPVWVLSWIIAFVTVGNSIRESKRVTWYGIATLVMLAIPAVPIAMMVFNSFWRFAASP
jgi:hypothetical protein